MGENTDPKKNIHAGHRARLKKRFITQGADAFEDHMLLELMLFYIIPQKDTNELAHMLIDKFGSFSGVFEASVESLCELPGITENGAVLIKLIPEIHRTYMKDKLNNVKTINSTSEAKKFFATEFATSVSEKFMMLCLDSKNKILKCSKISEGSITATEVNIRKIAQEAMSVNAVSVILAHNHPGGRAIPSAGDVRMTKAIIAALLPLDIVVWDHIIVADSKNIISMSDSDEYAHLF